MSYKKENDELVLQMQKELSLYKERYNYIPMHVLDDDDKILDKELGAVLTKAVVNLLIRKIQLRKYLFVQGIAQTISDEKWIIYKDWSMYAYDSIIQYLKEVWKEWKKTFFDPIEWQIKEKMSKSE